MLFVDANRESYSSRSPCFRRPVDLEQKAREKDPSRLPAIQLRGEIRRGQENTWRRKVGVSCAVTATSLHGGPSDA